MSGFVRGSGGGITKLNAPGALRFSTQPFGINDAGQIVGNFYDGTTHGFLLDGGVFITLDVPGSRSSTALGINDAGQIVGTFGKTGQPGGIGFIASLGPPSTPPPSPHTLAKLSSDAYNPTPFGADGYVSPANVFRITGGDNVITGTNGFAANVYQNGTQFVVAIRGTVPKDQNARAYNFVADAAFPTGDANPILSDNLEQVANILRNIHSIEPDAQVTLTGHSLGGAIAQIVGQAANIAVTSFDAPGAKALVSSFSDQLSSLPSLNIPSSSNQITNYRLYGDQVSLVGTQIGNTITIGNVLPNSEIDALVLPVGWLFNHDITTLRNQLGNLCDAIIRPGCATISDGALGRNILGIVVRGVPVSVPAGICAFIPLTCDLVAVAVKFVVDVAADVLTFIDPGPGRIYAFQKAVSSPSIRSIDLPEFGDVEGWSLQYHDSLGWSAFETRMSGGHFDFFTDVDALVYMPLSALGDPIFNPDPFAFGMTFASAGQLNATAVDFRAPSDFGAVPEPASIAVLGLGLAGLWLSRRRRLFRPGYQ